MAEEEQPLVLTNFFEICMPSAIDTAFLPRFTEFCNSACESRLATNNHGRDLCVDGDGTVTANLIIAICVTCEKKIVVPVQLCVLSTGFVQAPIQQNAICQTFPGLFPNQIRPEDTIENCREECREKNEAEESCGCRDCCDSCDDRECCDSCDDGCDPCSSRAGRSGRPQPRR